MNDKLTEEWLTENFFFDYDEWYKNASGAECRPLKIRVLRSSEYEDGWYVSLWDEDNEIVIYDGVDYTTERMETLYLTLSGKTL